MCASLHQESLWSRLFWLLIAADCLKGCAFSLFNNPSRLLQQRSASLLPKSCLNWQKFSKSEQLRCSAISQNFVILGGSGDLATTKIIPGLFDLCKQYSVLSKSTNSSKSPRQIGFDHDAANMGPSTDFNYDDFRVKLAARSVWSDDFLKDKLRNILSSNIEESSSVRSLHDQLVTEFLAKCSYTCIESYDSTAMSNLLDINNDYKEYGNAGKVKVKKKKVLNIVYFALPPKQYLQALNAIKDIQNNEINEQDEHQKIGNLISSEISKDISEENVVQDDNENDNNSNDSNNDNNENLIEIVLEKPIGYDIATALEITELALSAVKNREENIWCVDHYLAKDLAVAILPLKTSQIPSISRLFLEYWNKNYISDINIIFSDTGILDGRSGYFDECGITRDILQNHLIQLLALLCADINMISNFNKNMDYSDDLKKEIVIIKDYIKSNKIINNDNNEISTTNNTSSDIDIDKDDNDNSNGNANYNNNHIGKKWMDIKSDDRSNLISEMRAKILDSISPLKPTDLILGQYDSYSTEKGVKINTKTSTFSSCQIQVPGPTWDNTTFNLVAGKGLDKKESVIKISYRKKHFAAVRTAVRAIEKEFSRENISKIEDKDLESLTLVLQIQPSPGIYIEEQSIPLLSMNDNESQTLKSKRLLLATTDLPCWPEDNANNRPIPANSGTGPSELDDEIMNRNSQGNDMANVRCMEAYTRVIESVLLNKTKRELFPSISEVLLQWKIYGNALEIVEKSTHVASYSITDNREVSVNAKGKEIEKNSQILNRREEREEKEEKEEQNNSSSGNISLLVRTDEVLDVHVKKNILLTEEEVEKDVVFKVVEVEESTLRSYTVGSSIESIMNRNTRNKN